MPIVPFVVYSTAGALLWSTDPRLRRRAARKNWEAVRTALQPFDLVIAILVVVGLAVVLWLRLGRPSPAARAGPTSESSSGRSRGPFADATRRAPAPRGPGRAARGATCRWRRGAVRPGSTRPTASGRPVRFAWPWAKPASIGANRDVHRDAHEDPVERTVRDSQHDLFGRSGGIRPGHQVGQERSGANGDVVAGFSVWAGHEIRSCDPLLPTFGIVGIDLLVREALPRAVVHLGQASVEFDGPGRPRSRRPSRGRAGAGWR